MTLDRLRVENYRSLRDIDLKLAPLNVLIGANASGKSNILDALRFLAQGAQEKDFARAMGSRGNVVQLAWKGAEAGFVVLRAHFVSQPERYDWTVRVDRKGFDYELTEDLRLYRGSAPPSQLLHSHQGGGWWWSGSRDEEVRLSLAQPTGCALSAASVDESFPGRPAWEFTRGWGFFDPSPAFLRRATFPDEDEGPRLDSMGRNLAGRLFAIQEAKPEVFERIVSASRDLLGVPESIELRRQEYDGRIYFVQTEPGLSYPVHQLQVSSGTLRILALLTALLGEDDMTLVGIEEPENYVHPNALESFARYLLLAGRRVQIILTTHSPLLLNYLDAPEAVCLVHRGARGTEIEREPDPASVRRALEASRFGLGEFYETKGFGG
jgi:predicted ATPase